MLQKKSSAQETQITRKFRGRRTRGSPISSVFDLQQEEDEIEIQKLNHLPIQQPNLTRQKPLFRYRHERELPISNHCSTTAPKPLLSLANIARFCYPVHQSSFCTKPMSWFSIRGIGYRFLVNFSHARLLGVRFKVLVFISLPSLYLFLSYPHSFFVFYLLSIIAFIITLLISLHLAIPRLPSLRLLLSRSLPHKLNNLTKIPSKASKPVIWSIGSKPEVEKKPNSGTCVQVYSNGDVYEGEIHKGKCSGSGVYYYYMSGRYEGDWVDDKYDGYGVETWARGSRYRGQYRHGLRHGIGVYRFYAGDVYAGEWSNGQCHGSGVHTCEDGSKYVGEFKWGVKHGFGHYHFRNGDTYAGEYFADKMHGFGVYRFGNGHRYEGAWHEGRRQGLGMYTFRNGEAQSGHWHNGVLDALSAGCSPAGSSYAVSHSKVHDAVQEARRSAEKAYSVAKVDDRVNKIVAAANKAANAARVAAVKAVQRQIYHSNSQNSDDAPTLFV